MTSSPTTKGSTAAHQVLADDILHALGSRRDVRAWIRVVGFDRLKKIKYGIVGEGDIEFIVAPYGRMGYVECKSGGGKQTKEQKQWQAMIERFGGIYIVGRSVEQVLIELELKLK